MRVAKNTLVRRAIKGTSYEALDSNLGGQVGLILSYEDPVVLAKTFTAFGPLGDKLKLRGAVLDGKALTPGRSPGAGGVAAARGDFRPVARPVECAGDAVGPLAERAGLVSGARDRRDWKKERRWRGGSGPGERTCSCSAAARVRGLSRIGDFDARVRASHARR